MSALRKLRAHREQMKTGHAPVRNDTLTNNPEPSPTPPVMSKLSEMETTTAIAPTANTNAQVNKKEGKAKKKKKKKKKSKGNVQCQTEAEDLDAVFAEFKVEHSAATACEQSKQQAVPMLTTKANFLDMELEVKRRFGADVMKLNKKKRVGKTATANPRRRTFLSYPAEDWPPMRGGGLEMQRVQNDDGLVKEFCFSYSPDYAALEHDYRAAAATFNPQAIVGFGRSVPYHAKCNLQLSTLCESQGEFVPARAALCRSVYLHEVAFHRDFTPMEANCYLNFELEANRDFFKIMTKHAQLLAKTGCPRTALEVVKMTLSLAPRSDPCCLLLTMDYYALRAMEYRLLLTIFYDFRPDLYQDACPGLACALSPVHTPGFVFNAALAKLRTVPPSKLPKTLQTIDPAPLQLLRSGEQTKMWSASRMLQAAVFMFPEALHRLVRKCNDRELNKLKWKKLVAWFDQFSSPGSLRELPYLDKLLLVFVERCHSVWNEEEILDWLCANAQAVQQKLSSVPSSSSSSPPASSSSLPSSIVKERQQVRLSLYRQTPQALKDLQQSSYTDQVANIPAEFARAQAMAPPQPPQQQPPVDDVVRALFRSFLPWSTPTGPGPAPGAGEPDLD